MAKRKSVRKGQDGETLFRCGDEVVHRNLGGCVFENYRHDHAEAYVTVKETGESLCISTVMLTLNAGV
jgi:hypothetical protein